MTKNAIILAAGKSNRFAPFTYERPKGLFRVKGEYLVERQIRQMIEAGISDIYIVVGYMKEKFFFLESKYPQVHLLVNNRFGVKGNLYSLYVARQYLADTFISYADYYFTKNPFVDDNKENVSYHSGIFKNGKIDLFSLEYSDAKVITHVDIGGSNKMAMVGITYLNSQFSKRFVQLLNDEIDDFRVSSLFWEEFYERHIRELTLYLKEYSEDEILEFNSIDDLRQFDADFLENVNSEIITHICDTLHCEANSITDINVINAGLTNVSFRFTVNGKEYVYRHPGGTAGNLINRSAELFAQKVAKETEVDKSVIAIELSGWKLSYYVEDQEPCDFRKNEWQLEKGMEYLRRVHSAPITTEVKVFDDFEEGIKLMRIASTTKGNLLEEFAEEIAKAKHLSTLLKRDAQLLGYRNVLCHNDIYEPNFLATKDHDLYLIDWEYAGLNDPANDLACFFSRYDYSDEDIERFFKAYFQRELTEAEHRHYYAYIPLNAFYWFCWGLYKGSVGDDDGFFFLPAYRIFHRLIDNALNSFERK